MILIQQKSIIGVNTVDVESICTLDKKLSTLTSLITSWEKILCTINFKGFCKGKTSIFEMVALVMKKILQCAEFSREKISLLTFFKIM